MFIRSASPFYSMRSLWTSDPISGNVTSVMTPAEMCAHLIRFDTSNYGGGESNGETPLAEEIARLLQEAGYDPQVVARVSHRASVVVRVTGSRPDQPALLVHGHLDVVPAEPE